jgi:hypothetical protein
MKKTRRIEITRYSRRVTVIQGGDQTTASAESAVIEDIANVLEEGALAQMEVTDGQLRAVEATVLEQSRRRSRLGLRNWLRRRL